jgi:hypothetical protein
METKPQAQQVVEVIVAVVVEPHREDRYEDI